MFTCTSEVSCIIDLLYEIRRRYEYFVFLTPKSEVAFIYDDETLRQALEKMEHHKYSAVPIINRMGKYIGTITEGDMLWGIKNQYDLNLRDAV